MRTTLLTLGTILLFLVPSYAQIYGDCNDGDADFRWSIDGCCVTFYACNSAGFGTYNFGDGTTASGQGAYHCYSAPGVYTVSKTFNGQTVYNTIHITNCEQECDLTATYCPEGGGPCYTNYVPGSHYYYYCYQNYNVTTSGGTPPFTYNWQVCYDYGAICYNYSGSSINPIRYQIYYIWNGRWQLIFQRYITSVCVTVTDANGCEYEDCQGCPLTRPAPGDEPPLALLDGQMLPELPAGEELPAEPTVFPNVARAGQALTVILPYSQTNGRPLPARLVSLSGQLVEQYNLAPGRSELHLPAGLSNGVYLLQLSDGAGGMSTHKVVVR